MFVQISDFLIDPEYVLAIGPTIQGIGVSYRTVYLKAVPGMPQVPIIVLSVEAANELEKVLLELP